MNLDEQDAPASLAACPRTKLPASDDTFAAGSPFESLDSAYSIQARLSNDCSRCVSDRGFCRLDAKAQFYCSKSKVAENPPPVGENSRSGKMRLIIGLTSGAIGTVLICMIIFCCIIKSLRQKIEFLKTSRADQNIEAFIRNHGPLALTRYKYAEVKKMTKSFQVKLGQGGYGAVYKGELLNGCPVAIKLLKSSKGNGEEFINEVASISKTSHVNVVTLLGFCLEGRKKALIYEFMPNGSLDKFIRNTADRTSPSLTWEYLYEIAIGTARGLEYLYKGCNTRILHFDIKPHNILLDESFCPKISDFGLAKLCPRKESIVSISEARGTIGYLAPEVWNRNIGRVSHKSDIFSYGMLLLDMVGERKNLNPEDCTTETYFPDWIYDKLEKGSKLGQDDGANPMEENDIAKKLTIVGLWCIQTFPTQRPTISRVIEMLEGSLDSLEMPPKPVMLSPPRLELESSATCNTKSEQVDSAESSSQRLETH
ncbi:LEAF RUST 10 DISEASE-RESISTANCE LOCUS RECEPTOR-LIKE PROTEIN KINASE-like 2.5 [Neltuma alba]|uniref:LEAF RUST 10 DISEASE-RESISTANCE LOCUS RECEPTOR-LIKE PROTEIN KINASE-like 2.5 n=1 Tax=Neltuma alba TaxID=207710 RepID=UPI0010A41235|nr:LEAF RUST 10 DISEASE-RESISTANCE LOCUS RECEPTOR-LIKE PROTEIN KINASE-like 2.5 [Prosopis alba]